MKDKQTQDPPGWRHRTPASRTVVINRARWSPTVSALQREADIAAIIEKAHALGWAVVFEEETP